MENSASGLYSSRIGKNSEKDRFIVKCLEANIKPPSTAYPNPSYVLTVWTMPLMSGTRISNSE